MPRWSVAQESERRASDPFPTAHRPCWMPPNQPDPVPVHRPPQPRYLPRLGPGRRRAGVRLMAGPPAGTSEWFRTELARWLGQSSHAGRPPRPSPAPTAPHRPPDVADRAGTQNVWTCPAPTPTDQHPPAGQRPPGRRWTKLRGRPGGRLRPSPDPEDSNHLTTPARRPPRRRHVSCEGKVDPVQRVRPG